MNISLIYALIVLLTGVSTLAIASVEKSSENADLYTIIKKLDHELFGFFNKCSDPLELEKHAAYFAPDVEFYHDNGGVTWTRDAMLQNTKKYACGNFTRELVEGSFKVSTIKNFGAIATGVHRFCQNASQECEGEADFVMVWRNTNGKWVVTRTLSFGHRSAQGAESSTTNLD